MTDAHPEGLYSRQETLPLEIPAGIAIVGCGGVGSWVAIFAAMSGVHTIYLYDPDDLEESNRNRLPFCTGSINRPKVEVVADFIKAIRPDALVFPVASKFTADLVDPSIDGGVNFLIECTDSPKSQIELYSRCKKEGLQFIRAGYDGTHITVTSNVSGWIKKESEEERYAIAPSWVVPSAVVAALAVYKLMYNRNQEVGLDLSEIGIPVLDRQKRVTARCGQPRKRGTSTPEEEE